MQKNGFTLLEIIISMVILSVILGIFLPNMLYFSEQAKIEKSGNTIASIQRAMRFYTSLNDIIEGEELLSTAFIGNEQNDFIEIPNSPFDDGGYNYLEEVPAYGTCYASENSSKYGALVLEYVTKNGLCK